MMISINFCATCILVVAALSGVPASAEETLRVDTIKNIQIINTDKARSVIFETRLVETSYSKEVYLYSLTFTAGDVVFNLALPDGNAGGSSLIRFRKDGDGLAAFTGGFLDTFSPATPIGLVQSKNDVLSELISSSVVMTAVVCYRFASVVIMRLDEFSAGQTEGDCIQTGPLLVRNGKGETNFEALERSLNGYPFAQRPFQRGFILTNARREVVIGVCSGISLFALRELMLKKKQEAGFEALDAVALSGGRTAGLVWKGGGDKIVERGSVRTLLPNAVVVKERKP